MEKVKKMPSLAFRLNTYEASRIRQKVLESLCQRKESEISILLSFGSTYISQSIVRLKVTDRMKIRATGARRMAGRYRYAGSTVSHWPHRFLTCISTRPFRRVADTCLAHPRRVRQALRNGIQETSAQHHLAECF